MGTRDPRIDAYIAKQQAFARPILERIRDVVHAACPEVQETMKWSAPHFGYRDQMMCRMVAFTAHASLGFWKAALIPGTDHLRRLTSVEDLRSKKELTAFIRAAMKLNDDGVVVPRSKGAPKAAAAIPEELAAALAKNRSARAAFDAFPPSHRREYTEWIGEAKRDETRAKRAAQAVEWIAEGKARNWKYERPKVTA